MTLADTAAEIAEELGPVFPCKANKAPLTTHGFKDASDDSDKIYELFSKAPEAALIGIATGEIVVVDIDRKNGKDGFRWPALAELPLTRTQRTPSGGEHRLYRVPLGRRLGCSQNAVYPGIDIRGDGGYIATGAGYQWINKEDIAELTPELCDLLSPLNKAGPFEDPGVTAEDIAGIDHGNWHEPVLRIVGKLVAKGIDDATIHAITDRFTLNGYTVAQTRSEVAEMIRGARDKGWAPEVSDSKYPPIISADALFDLEPPAWLIDDVLPEHGVGFVSGATGSFKSFLCVHVALAVANGTAFGQSSASAQGRVLYTANEGRFALGGRIRAAAEHNGLSAEGLDTWPGINLTSTKDVEHLIENAERYDLVIIDTLAKASSGLDENSNSEMGKALSVAQQLADEWHSMVLMVAHVGKDASRGIRGASALHAGADVVLAVKRTPDTKHVSIRVDKQKDGPDGARFDFKLEDAEVAYRRTGEVIKTLVAAPTVGERSAADWCLEALSADADMTGPEVHERVTGLCREGSYSPVTEAAVKMALSRGVKAGTLSNNGGKYRVLPRAAF
jgi:hypothetical protein